MQQKHLFRPARRIIFFILSVLLVASAFGPRPSQAKSEPETTAAGVRTHLNAVYEMWERARVEYDREAMEAILAPEFFVLSEGDEISRSQFLEEVSKRKPTSRIKRFDADILTVRRVERGWQVVISEKLEYEIDGSEGQTRTAYSFWVTRDNCRKQDGKWLLTSSEAISFENWESGMRPPFGDW
jgi:hypothetical protein